MKNLFQTMVSKLIKKPVTTTIQETAAPKPIEIPKPVIARAGVPQILITGGPMVTISSRGSILYASCPECSAVWNVRERLIRRHLLKADNEKALTCPACEKAVGLPANVDMRKLS
jgi:hypothetical protein